MDKQIPIYFDSVVVSSPLELINSNEKNLGRLQVRVFTKYGNRNGSYISDAVAEQLIKSATTGNVPVIGFFDPESKSWASHTGPTLANAYGYVEGFVGWQPFVDTDGVTRDYAVFSVVLFTKYFEEANKILGQNQSMELNPETITGEWALIGDEEYYIYKTAEMLGFCIIGNHEPCFSVSAFFSKNDDTYKSQYEKFSSLLFDLKAQVEEAENDKKGGEQPMNEFENQEQENLETETPVVENPQIQEEEAPQTFEETQEVSPVEETVEQAPIEETHEEPTEEVVNNTEFEQLQQQFNDLQTSLEQLQNDYNVAQARIAELETFQTTANVELETLRAQNTELQTSVSNYEAAVAVSEQQKKQELIDKYTKIFDSKEEIDVIASKASDMSYDELESKLAIMYANAHMADSEEKKVPLPEPPESQFALLMKKYRKN